MRRAANLFRLTLAIAAFAVIAGIMSSGITPLSTIPGAEAASDRSQLPNEARGAAPQTEVDPLQAAKDYVDAAITRYRADPEEAMAYYRTPESFGTNGLYLSLVRDGTVVLSPVFPAGENSDLTWRVDPLGNRYGEELSAADEDGAVVEYLLPIRNDNYTFRNRTSWAVLADGLVFFAGLTDMETDVESGLTEEQKAVGATIKARTRIQAETAVKTLAYYKTLESIDGEFYVWVAGPLGNIQADATMPELEGTNIADAYPEVGQAILAVQPQQTRWISHMWENPATEQEESKHTYVTRFFNFYIVSGYYGDTPPRQPAPPTQPNDPCIEAIDGAGAFDGTWGDDCLSGNRPEDSTNNGDANEDYYARFYTFTLKDYSDVTITLSSDKDAFLYLMEGEGKDGTIAALNDDHDSSEFSLASNRDSGISATLNAGDYTIESTTYNPTTAGDFTLVVEINASDEPSVSGAKYSAVSSGANHVCALATDGSIMCWGDNSEGQRDDRPTSGTFTAISSGDDHTCALRDDGAVICWGSIQVP